MSSTGALLLADVPASLLILGGGYVGLELGTVYAALGSRVTLVELQDRLLPGVDRDLVEPLQRRLEAIFEAIRLRTRVTRLQEDEAGVTVGLEGEGAPPEQRFDRVLVAIGRAPATQGLGLEHTRVRLDAKGFIQVDAQQRTADERIFAIGDAVGRHDARPQGDLRGQGGGRGDRRQTRGLRRPRDPGRGLHRPADRLVRHDRGAGPARTARR